MKTLHILYSGLGGASSVVFSLLKENQKKSEIKQKILFTGSYLFKDHKDKVNNISNIFFYIKTKNFFPWFYWFKVFLFLCKEKPDIIFLHNFQIIATIFYKIIFKKKVIYIDHAAENFLKLKSFIASTFSLFFFNLIIFVNKKKSLNYKKKFNLFKKKIFHISNSVDVNFFKRNTTNNKMNTNIFRIGMAARLDDKKRHELIIKALKHPKLRSLNIIFSIVGDGERREELKLLVKNMRLNNKVLFDGVLNRQKMKEWYQKLNLYVQATDGEGMSISILEAMSMQVPVIGSDVVGVNNLLNIKSNIGMLFKNKTDDLADKIYFFFRSTEHNKKLFENKQRDFILKNYSSMIMFNNYKKIILKIMPSYSKN